MGSGRGGRGDQKGRGQAKGGSKVWEGVKWIDVNDTVQV